MIGPSLPPARSGIMPEQIYRKSGTTSRVELHNGRISIVEIEEIGESHDSIEHFSSRTLSTQSRSETNIGERTTAALASADQFKASVPGSLVLERLVLLSGRADHSIVHEGKANEWTESFERLHISLMHPEARERVEVEVGGSSLDMIDRETITSIASLLARMDREPVTSRELNLSLEPVVAAALWAALTPWILGGAPGGASGPTLDQSIHPELAHDGNGLIIAPKRLFGIEGGARWSELPNMFRPSYRAKPVSMPFHLRANPIRSDVHGDYEAHALLQRFIWTPVGLAAKLLCRSRNSDSVFASTIVMTPERWLQSVVGIDSEMTWFPNLAGTYGSRTLIRIP
ncbi:MAG TPA: hypothetical protein VNM92_17160 [Thermoanaerobaculia bacterium]|nr:hypothetical protein [Thermoanaerobaculia bacterium]